MPSRKADVSRPSRPASAVVVAVVLAFFAAACDATVTVTVTKARVGSPDQPTAEVLPSGPTAPVTPRRGTPPAPVPTTTTPTTTTPVAEYDPVTTITAPEAGASVRTPLTIRGEAAGSDRIGRVTITVKDTATNTYWNPATGEWQDEWLWYDASLASTTSPSTTWSFHLDPAGTTPTGLYQATAFAWDGQGHKDPTGSRVRFVGTEPVAHGEWALVWADDFDGTTLDPHRWKTYTGDYGTPYRDQYYTDRPENVRVEDGRLILEARAEPFGDQGHTSGMVVSNDVDRAAVGASRGNLSWTYGRYEVRAKVPDVAGMWPAFWMRPATSAYGAWPRSGEIDVMEYAGPTPKGVADPRGRFLVANLHTWDPDGDSGTSGGSGGSHQNEGVWWVESPDFFDEFHTWAVEWEADRLRWYVDDQLFHVADRNWQAPGAGFPAPFDQPFFLTLNLQVGGWAGPVAAGTPPTRFEIDHVRVYR